MLKLVILIKNILIVLPLTLILQPFSKLFLFIAYFNNFLVWVYKNRKYCQYNQPFTISRNHGRRYGLYEFIVGNYQLRDVPVIYLEFGVAGGHSFKWWLENNVNPSSVFRGFDTFEGLPEKWGAFFRKGDMDNEFNQPDDTRALFVKGLFQDTLIKFIPDKKNALESPARKIIHMDADLYSSTIFVLSQLYPFLRKGDIILFDEFNVAMHEFRAFRDFTRSFYITLEPVGAVNNFYQVAFIVK